MCKLVLLGMFMVNLCNISYIQQGIGLDEGTCEIYLRDGKYLEIENSNCSEIFRKIESAQHG